MRSNTGAGSRGGRQDEVATNPSADSAMMMNEAVEREIEATTSKNCWPDGENGNNGGFLTLDFSLNREIVHR